MKRINILSLCAFLCSAISGSAVAAVLVKPVPSVVIVEQLLAQGAGAKAINGGTALHFAAETKDFCLIKRVFSSDVDIHATDECGYTAFHWAIMNNNLDGAKLLWSLAQQVCEPFDINAKDRNKLTALDWAIVIGNKEMINFLRKNGAVSARCDSCHDGLDFESVD